MTDEQLTELERLCEAATPGPWTRGSEYDMESGEETPDSSVRGPEYEQTWGDVTHPVSDCVCMVGFSAHSRHRANQAFIIAARTALPALIAKVRQLRSRCRESNGKSNAQQLAAFLNLDLRMAPERVNKALDIMREAFPQVMWDIPEEQTAKEFRKLDLTAGMWKGPKRGLPIAKREHIDSLNAEEIIRLREENGKLKIAVAQQPSNTLADISFREAIRNEVLSQALEENSKLQTELSSLRAWTTAETFAAGDTEWRGRKWAVLHFDDMRMKHPLERCKLCDQQYSNCECLLERK